MFEELFDDIDSPESDHWEQYVETARTVQGILQEGYYE